MGEHKTNRNSIMASSRPKCGTCPHFIEGAKRDAVGECSFWPFGTVHVMITPPRIAGQPAQMLPTTVYAPKLPDQFCGQHPEFMRWYGENRERIREVSALDAKKAEGEA